MEKEKMKLSKKILIVLLVIVLIVVLGILFHMIRNYIIISHLQKNFEPYAEATNYHTKTSYDTEEMGHVEIDSYRKDEKKALFIVTTNTSGEVSKLLTYDNGKRVDFFSETPEEKNAQLGISSFPNLPISNGLESENGFQTFLACFLAKIEASEHEGRECYVIQNFFTNNQLYDVDGDNVSFVDKETGLEFMKKTGGRVEQKMAEINTVDDSIFVEPNIGEYELRSNNT